MSVTFLGDRASGARVESGKCSRHCVVIHGDREGGVGEADITSSPPPPPGHLSDDWLDNMIPCDALYMAVADRSTSILTTSTPTLL